MRYLGSLLAALTMISNGYAGTVHEALMRGQVQQFTDKGVVSACGLVIAAVEQGAASATKLHIFNGSYMLADFRGGMVKGRAAVTSGKSVASGALDEGSIRVEATNFVWLKARGKRATALIEGQKIHKANEPGYIMYLTDLEALLELTSAVIDGEPIQIGMQMAKMNHEVILSGTVLLSKNELEQLTQCMTEWADVQKAKFSDSPGK